MKPDSKETIHTHIYRWTQRIRLFLAIVWRGHETKRLDVRTAWEVACCFYGKRSKKATE